MRFTWSRRRKLTIVSVGALNLALVLTILLIGHDSHPHSGANPQPPTAAAPVSSLPTPAATSTSASPTTSSPALPPLVRTNDPVQYATAVATALFGVDPAAVTRTRFVQLWQRELPTVVYADGAVNGLTLTTQNGDAMDNLTTSWIPSAGVWQDEARAHTVNTVKITSVSVPDFWGAAVANGTFTDPGLRMERVMGIVTQTYQANAGHPVTTTRPVVIDLGLLCPPTQPGGCRLLAPQLPDGASAPASR
jgi:hypothetical protein